MTMNKKEQLIVNPITGVSGDYINSYFGAYGNFESNDREAMRKSYFEKNKFISIKKYEDYFIEKGYFDLKDLINDKNRKNVEKIDELIDELNKRIKIWMNDESPELRKELEEIFSELIILIRERNLNDI